MKEARELLKKIGVTNEIEEIKEFCLVYEDKAVKSYRIVTELGEIDFRIIQLKDHKVSKLDFFNTGYKFNRNVNLLAYFMEVESI